MKETKRHFRESLKKLVCLPALKKSKTKSKTSNEQDVIPLELNRAIFYLIAKKVKTTAKFKTLLSVSFYRSISECV